MLTKVNFSETSAASVIKKSIGLPQGMSFYSCSLGSDEFFDGFNKWKCLILCDTAQKELKQAMLSSNDVSIRPIA